MAKIQEKQTKRHVTEAEKLISAVMKGNNVAGKAQLTKILKQKARERIKDMME